MAISESPDLTEPPAGGDRSDRDTGKLPRLSPSALNRFLDCEHRSYLDMLDRRGELDAERLPPRLGLLMARGERHEEAVLGGLEDEGLEVVSLEDPDASVEERAARTLAAMRAGHPILYQACFAAEGWVGYPDFLIRVEEPSALGSYSYEVHDAKLSAHPHPRHLFQLLFYTDALERLQGHRPERMHLILGSGEHPAYAPVDFTAYGERIKGLFVDRQAELEAGAEPAYPYPVGACQFCPWWKHCEERRRADDHLSLVAGLQRRQGLRLEQAGIRTLAALATIEEEVVVPRLSAETLANLRAQASLQLRSRGLERPLYELLEPEWDRGLSRLPAPSPADVHFDFEGDPYWGEDGLEYLFGTVYLDEHGEEAYLPIWGTSREQERQALERWIDWITERLSAHPEMHVYHYGSHEPTTLKGLVARHATRELELDELLRRRVFVDLYGITRQALRAGVESYGLKAIEALPGFHRDEQLDGLGSLARWQRWQDTGDHELLREIAIYNRDDCLSTARLADWLYARRPEAEARFDVAIGELAPEPARPPSEHQLELQRRTEALRGTLLAGLPDDEGEDTEEQRVRRLAFALTGYHTREAKPVWWAYFDRRTKTVEELRDDDGEAIGDLELVKAERLAKSWEWTLRYPPQDHKIEPGRADDPIAEAGVNVIDVDEATRTVVVRRSVQFGDQPPRAIAPGGPFDTSKQIDAVFEFAEDIAARGLEGPGIGRDLLLRRRPRLRPGTPPLQDGPVDLERLIAQVRGLDRSVLMIQGPPGSGKTWTGARIALALMGVGLRVGVMATAHKAIDNLLEAIDEAADELGTTFRGWRKPGSEGQGYESDRIHLADRPDEEDGPVLLHASTAWYWAREEVAGSVDVLIVDEAGQVSLADAIAVGRGARSMVLLGDPQQLAHVSQGTHPFGAGASVLEHLLGEHDTVPPDRGVLLDVSWRLHPDLCKFVSDTMYDRRLSAEDATANQRVEDMVLGGTGLRMIGVEHDGNRGHSIEEAQVIAGHVERLVAAGHYVDRKQRRHRLTLEDILIVAPYNAQVRCLRSVLPEGARVGTVDKFQGQEAPIVFFSMATSTDEDMTRGISFLYSRNRLNVAISRAQSLAVIVCSPQLLRARCSSVEDMKLVNMLCRAADTAVHLPTVSGPCG